MSDIYELTGMLKANGYVAASEGFEEQPAVMNGANHLWPRSSATPARARTAIGVPSLPGGAPVELIASLST